MLYAWIFLVAAISTEVAATLILSESSQTGDLSKYALMWFLISLSYVSLAFALRRIQVGVAVAIWEGLGVALIAVISIVYLHEPVSAQKIIGIATSLCGIALLNFGSDD
jgi:multidrug transporter EmrE-like cation transporter